MKPAIELQGVSAAYHRTPVLNDLTVTVAEGEMVGILGPNGAGKTTLFRILSGLHPAAAGTVRLFGRDVARLPAAERARLVAVVPQELAIPVAFTVEEIVLIGRTASQRRWSGLSAHDRHVVERALVYTDAADIRDRPFNELSGGEQQRVIVAMALAQEPRLILMDEATSHLDINHRLEIMQLVERLNTEEGVTVLMISHDLQLAAEFSRRLLLLDHGRLVADGAPADVLTEAALRAVYHCDIRVAQDAQTGALSILPAPRLVPGCSGHGLRVHVVAGGGCGEEVMRRLALCGYTLSCGVLNRGDLDTDVARALGAEIALEEPFSPVGPKALAAAGAMVQAADAVLLSPVPFGPGNVANLDLLTAALDQGRPVFVMEDIESRDYTPGREAVAKVRALLGRGAKPWRNVADLLMLLPSRPAQPAVSGNR
jgi:iron complex transport system ATP-binding protein